MAPDFPSFSRPPISPSNVGNEKRGGQGGRMLRKRRRQRDDGTWEEYEDEEDEAPDAAELVELENDSFQGKGSGQGLDDFMSDALPWEAEDALVARELAQKEAIAQELALAEERATRASFDGEAAAIAAVQTGATDPACSVVDAAVLAADDLAVSEALGLRLPVPPLGLPSLPKLPTGRGTGGLSQPQDPSSGPALPTGRGTGSLAQPPLPPRRTTAPLPPLPNAHVGAGGPSPYLQGRWEYQVVDGRTGRPVAAMIELTFLEARLMPVRRRQQSDHEGWIKGQGLPPGRYQMTLQAPGYHAQSEVRFLRADAADHSLYRMQPD